MTPPDLHPNNVWGVDNQLFDGDTYLGLSVRNNNSYKSVSQRLSTKTLANKCYELSMDVAVSKKYISGTRKTPSEEIN